MKNWSGTSSFLYLAFFTILNPIGIHSFTAFSYNETEPGYRIRQTLTYRDGISVAHLVKPINETCNEPRIDLRIMYQDGTVELAEVEHPIPDFNFCKDIKLFVNMPDNIIIFYENSTDINSASYYALLVTRSGKFISNNFLSRVPVIDGSLSFSGDMLPHINEEQGFLFWSLITETSLQWIYFESGSDRSFNPKNNGQIELPNRSDSFDIFATIDRTFGLVTSNHTNVSPGSLMDPTESTFELYITFIKPNENAVDGPFLLYQTAIPNLHFKFQCNFAFSSMDYFCILNIREDQLKKRNNKSLIKITFRDTGSVVDVEKFSNLNLYKYLTDSTLLNSLHHGGFLALSFESSENYPYKTIQATILNNDGNYNSTLDLPKNLKAPDRLTNLGFRKNTLVVTQQENEYTWKIYEAEYPGFTYNGNGYDNTYIQSTYPSIDTNIPLSTNNISITYQSPIAMSTRNISIYQYDNENSILRQSIPGSSPFFSRSPDNKTLILNILESTFNRPNAKYYVVINDNTVQDWKTHQPISGVESNIWKFNTVNTNNQNTAEDANGLLSLTVEGTRFYENLSPYDKAAFLSQLKIDLAISIPVDINRLDDIKCYKYDKSQQPPKILLTLPIKSTTNSNEPSVNQIIKDLNTLVQKKEVTPISWYTTTNFLDENFGFQRSRNFIDDYKFHLIGILIGLIVLILLYFYAHKRHPKGENIVVLKLFLIIADFVLDIVFILMNGKTVPELFTPSIIFCAVPMIMNSIISMVIILQEITQNKSFYEWFKQHTTIAALFTILASADLEVLNTLSSQVAGIMILDAPLSDIARSYIFWGSFIGLFVEDIPQFIVQVVYAKSTVAYDIIPLLTLTTSLIVLTINIVSRIYVMIVHLRTKRSATSNTSDTILPTNQKTTFESDKALDSVTVPEKSKAHYRYSV